MHKRNLNALQLVRAIAVILVVFHHTYRDLFNGLEDSIFNLLEFGALGVDLFFVLSGFIIFYVHFSDLGTGINQVKSFFIKRIIRIYPIYWLVTIGYIIVRIVLAKDSFSAEFLIKSFLLIPDDIQPILGVAWSLRHEMLFYVIFSLLIFNKKFISAFYLWAILTILFVIAPINIPNNSFLELLLSPLNLEFLLGCLVALIYVKKIRIPKWLISLGAISFAGSIFVLNETIHYTGLTDSIRVIAFGIPSFLLILGLVGLSKESDEKTPKSLVYIGNASYSIYLTHLVIIYILGGPISRINADNSTTEAALIMVVFAVLQIILGCLFYSIVEKTTVNYLKSNFISRNNSKKINFKRAV